MTAPRCGGGAGWLTMETSPEKERVRAQGRKIENKEGREESEKEANDGRAVR